MIRRRTESNLDYTVIGESGLKSLVRSLQDSMVNCFATVHQNLLKLESSLTLLDSRVSKVVWSRRPRSPESASASVGEPAAHSSPPEFWRRPCVHQFEHRPSRTVRLDRSGRCDRTDGICWKMSWIEYAHSARISRTMCSCFLSVGFYVFPLPF